MTDDISYETTGKELDDQLTAIGDRLDSLEDDITDLKDEVDEDDKKDHEHEQYLTADDAIALINEHGASIPEDRLEAIDQELANIREAIGMVRGGVSSTIGPDVPDDGFEHSTPGWGAILTIDEPRQFRDCTVVSNQSGNFEAELWEYDGDAGDLVDSTTINVISDGEHDVDLDLQAPEPGVYLLTRDYDKGRSDISLWRTNEDWDGWGEIDSSLTLHNSAHPDYGGEPKYFYYFFSCEVLPYYPDGGEYGAEYGDDYGNGDG